MPTVCTFKTPTLSTALHFCWSYPNACHVHLTPGHVTRQGHAALQLLKKASNLPCKLTPSVSPTSSHPPPFQPYWLSSLWACWVSSYFRVFLFALPSAFNALPLLLFFKDLFIYFTEGVRWGGVSVPPPWDHNLRVKPQTDCTPGCPRNVFPLGSRFLLDV